MPKPRPLLIISDSVTAPTGLGRIARELADRIHARMKGVFRVGTCGYGGVGSRERSYPQYYVEGVEKQWVIHQLPEIWQDFAGDEQGVILCIWDASRLSWFAHPALCQNPELKTFLTNPPFEKWIYAPIDAEGPNRKLTFPLQQTLLGFDRILAYGNWAAGVIDRSLGNGRLTPFLPHGIDYHVFRPRNRENARQWFPTYTQAGYIGPDTPKPIRKDELLIGIVATNQARKDWALGIEAAAILAKNHKVRLWIHTDLLERHWSIPALIIDHGLHEVAMISLGHLTDEKMAEAYSACDLTFGIGLGEGMGFPIFESLACGTPCIHGDYGGAPEWMIGRVQGIPQRRSDEPLLVPPVAYRYEGVYSCKRPVFSAEQWALQAAGVIGHRMNRNGELDWENLWPHWEHWLTNEGA